MEEKDHGGDRPSIGQARERKHYILKDKEVVEVDWREWAEWFETADRRVALDHVSNYRISTVFLGLDHRFLGDGPPDIFETMVFDDNGESPDRDLYCDRYSTWEEALAGHQKAVERYKIEAMADMLGKPPSEERH